MACHIVRTSFLALEALSTSLDSLNCESWLDMDLSNGVPFGSEDGVAIKYGDLIGLYLL